MNPRQNHPWCILLYAALVLLIASWVAAVAQGGEWEFSPPAPYHAAIVRVQSGQKTGSGVYVTLNEQRGVLTAAHIVNRSKMATVTWSDGTTSSGKAHYDKYGYDVGIVVVTHPTIQPLAVANAPPAPGGRVEFVTCGGPEDRLRSFWSTFQGERQLQVRSEALYTSSVSPGDSGGAILDSSSKLVGIVVGGRSPSINGDGWKVYRGPVSAPLGPIRAFAQRVLCPPGGCPPRGSLPPRDGMIWERGGRIRVLPPGWERRDKIEFYPPRQQDPPPVLPGPGVEPPDELLVPAEPETPPADQDAIAAIDARLEKLEALIAAIPAGRPGDTGQQGGQGIQGKPGAPGEDGVDGEDGVSPTINLDALAAKVIERLPPLPVRQIQMVRNADGELVEGETSVIEVYFSKGEALEIRLHPPE